jgi:predicted amidohydrolase
MIFLPEASDFITINKEETLKLTTTLANSEFLLGLQDLAKKENVWVSVGVHESTPVPTKVYNTHVVIDDNGELVSAYRKIHLFNVDIENGPRLMESDSTVQGERILDPVQTPVGKLGLETCYDMRFSELSIALRRRGAELLAFPSAFTIKTGEAHWGKNLLCICYQAIETKKLYVDQKHC